MTWYIGLFPANFIKGNNFHDFLLLPWRIKPLKRGPTLTEGNNFHYCFLASLENKAFTKGIYPYKTEFAPREANSLSADSYLEGSKN